jgi:hypothetical protein
MNGDVECIARQRSTPGTPAVVTLRYANALVGQYPARYLRSFLWEDNARGFGDEDDVCDSGPERDSNKGNFSPATGD